MGKTKKKVKQYAKTNKNCKVCSGVGFAGAVACPECNPEGLEKKRGK